MSFKAWAWEARVARAFDVREGAEAVGIPVPPLPTKDAESHYDPDQKRDATGKWTKMGEAQGSNPGGVYELGGIKHYVKHYATPDQARSEVLAAEVLAALGLQTTRPKIAHVNEHKMSVVSEIKNVQPLAWPEAVDHLSEDGRTDLAAMYYGAVLTKNWDVLGLDSSNIMIDEDTGKLVQMDTGGTFNFRAQGGHKDYGGDIAEAESLMDRGLPSGAVFSRLKELDPDAFTRALERVRNIEAGKVNYAFNHAGLDNQATLLGAFWSRYHKLTGAKKADTPQSLQLEHMQQMMKIDQQEHAAGKPLPETPEQKIARLQDKLIELNVTHTKVYGELGAAKQLTKSTYHKFGEGSAEWLAAAKSYADLADAEADAAAAVDYAQRDLDIALATKQKADYQAALARQAEAEANAPWKQYDMVSLLRAMRAENGVQASKMAAHVFSVPPPEPTEDITEAVEDYVGGSSSLNGSLRAHKGVDAEKMLGVHVKRVARLDKAIAEAKGAPTRMLVERGIPLRVVEKLELGEHFTDHGFMSTSFSGKVAEEFAGDARLVITVPKGFKMLSIPSFAQAVRTKLKNNHHHVTNAQREAEALLPRGVTLKITKIEHGTKPYGTTVVHGRAVYSSLQPPRARKPRQKKETT